MNAGIGNIKIVMIPIRYILNLLKFSLVLFKINKMKDSIIGWIKSLYSHTVNGKLVVDEKALEKHEFLWTLAMIGALCISVYVLWIFTRFVMVQILNVIIDKTRTHWDDYLVKNKFFRALAQLVPLMFLEYFLSIVFHFYPRVTPYTDKLITVLIIGVIILIVNRFLNSARDIYMEIEKYRDKPINSYIQIIKIISIGILIISMFSVLTGIDASKVFISLGTASAIVVLVFKDTILGFVGSMQLSANDMVRMGDWVTMDKYGADGTVEEVNLTTVKVRNFDKTITTIPTYSFISDSFKNWRGMQESDGRRIKRSVRININTIKFADDELISRLKNIRVLSEFIEKRQTEIKNYNIENGFVGDNAINGRKQTNIGIFRQYVQYYLQHKVEINQDMTLMARQQDPTDTGIPIEIYCFTITKEWEEYEAIVADIFDHVLAMVPVFDLQIFEQPSGYDFKSLIQPNV